MIPKIIHYTWFSNEPFPEKVQRCIDSWKRIMPDYELKIWNMDSIKDIDSVFLKEALSVKKWAYAADFVRLYAIYNYGGIYLDTDVVVYKPFDEFLNHQVFIGKESSIHFTNEGSLQGLTSHCFGAEQGHPYIKKCLDYFENRHFVISKDTELPTSLRMNMVLLPYIQAAIAVQFGYDWRPSVQCVQKIEDGIAIYPSVIFDPFQGKLQNRKKSYCLHLAMGGWRDFTRQRTKIGCFEKILVKVLGSFFQKMNYCIMKFD